MHIFIFEREEFQNDDMHSTAQLISAVLSFLHNDTARKDSAGALEYE